MQPFARHAIALLALLTGCLGAAGGSSGDEPTASDAAGRAVDNDAGPGGGGVSTSGFVVGQGNPATASVCPESPQGSFAAGLRIREIALYQTVKIPLYQQGAWLAERAAPVVQHKASLLRVFVDTMPGYAQREVRGVLALHDGASSTLITAQLVVGGNSTDAQLGSSFNFQVAPELIGPNTELSVWLEEPACARATGFALDARVPQVGSSALAAVAIAPLEVVILPVRIDGRLPVINETELANMKQALLAHYPVPDVTLSVRAPLDWSHPLDSHGGSTWSDLLNRIEQERSADGVPANVYYFGLAQPAVSSGAYCSDGCALGLAPQNTDVLPAYQTALGASFADAQTYDTMVHELGHAHGRAHAPCSPNGKIDYVDVNFPTPNAATDSWGWDSRNNTLKPPNTKDVMGYCNPTWVGLYTYAAIAARSAQVNRAPSSNEKSIRQPSEAPWQRVLLYADQSARWGGPVAAPTQPGQVEQAQVLDRAGHIVAHVEVVRTQLSEGADAFLNIPTPAPDWAALQLVDRKLVLSTIAAAL